MNNSDQFQLIGFNFPSDFPLNYLLNILEIPPGTQNIDNLKVFNIWLEITSVTPGNVF